MSTSARVQTDPAPTLARRLALAAATAAALLVAGNAGAGAADAAPAVHVRYDDLNLMSDAGTRVLLRRLSAAARAVCVDDGERELRRMMRGEACYRETLAEAVAAVHNERLTELYRVRTGTGAG